MIEINDDQQLTIFLGATRYYLGRQTYAVSEFVDTLVHFWPQLAGNVKDMIKRDVEEEFARDDRARANNSQFKPLGANCDRLSWERARDLWKEEHGGKET